jgi:hypothetical protein
MVTKEEFNTLLDRMVTKEEFAVFQAETRQNFRDVREISLVFAEKRSLNLTTFLAVLNM